MADDPHSNLADGWEAVESEDGRGYYWWNVNSNKSKTSIDSFLRRKLFF